ncbi:unnamed protein product [Spirodela intermedia]|uniref:Uncharacterized protein n=2 Tax=Spirodela intermedia TaxID=51605 RepID=A0A7I8J9E2_SPIIN|nr:unnamed protein product [Spirodela intermedia]CAA6666611.1 unnamed protein product [Spirodela intermedia]CAA7403409.1 unnamed protein product [Spirodela intermedia]
MYVELDDSLGIPSIETLSNWFKVIKVKEDSYKLVFCLNVCKLCKHVYGDLGLFVEDGKA